MLLGRQCFRMDSEKEDAGMQGWRWMVHEPKVIVLGGQGFQ